MLHAYFSGVDLLLFTYCKTRIYVRFNCKIGTGVGDYL